MNTNWMAACGPAAVVLTIAGNEAAGSTMPGIDASGEELATYLRGLDPGWVGLGIEIVGLLALLAFAAYLASLLHGVAANLVLAGGAAAAALKLASIAPVAGLWLRPETVDPQVAGLILDANSAAFVLTGAVSGLLVAGASVSGLLPRWLSVFGGVTAVALVVGIAGYREEFALGFLLYLIWTFVTGIVLLRPRTRASREPAGHAPPHPA